MRAQTGATKLCWQKPEALGSPPPEPEGSAIGPLCQWVLSSHGEGGRAAGLFLLRAEGVLVLGFVGFF